jgi:hypothetical protein
LYIGNSIYEVPFELQGAPIVNKFVARNDELRKIEAALLPRPTHDTRRKVFTLYGLGGMGKTQLAVEFARMHKRTFSAVFWLDGSSRSRVEQSIAAITRRLPQEQIPKTSRVFSYGSSSDLEIVIPEVLTWLSRPANDKWLLVFDNVDRDDSTKPRDVDAFNPEVYFPAADHGSILITTRLSQLEQLGDSLRLPRMSEDQGKSVLELRTGKSFPGETNPFFKGTVSDANRLEEDHTTFRRITSCPCSSWVFYEANQHKC